ncbi:UDP-N-acetylglucosamine--LPS N-acetylglucosamine transferase [Nostoc sp. TCL26-01]|uniref:UDP-N-acetylglucosamine--LPS N-acetylglucosamine transferase n=1 Tax=Nostoc sp. TCL26-01 TaxID=2576904 RepID=UPI0015BA7D91|nr:UDP-N-acetylglucosamine--LPS N-acetylglucosamine transferase [Nostoc sp. TCL26-01]QLE56996.1 UDP-N-acetylglucosamine--LPS N-acetylglucosamine transferase [Nostoc sp. TCL26-01]
MTKTWLIYALGGGWGHLTRALSLGRIAAKQRKVRIITNSPYASQINNEGCLIHWIPDNTSFSATCVKVREILLNTHYDCLIIDTFPRGLGGELVDILPQLPHIPRILIHRDINPRYVIEKELRSFVVANFDAVIVPGEGTDLALADLPGVLHTAPWLIRNSEELADKMSVRSHIFPSDISSLSIIICASGQASELSLFGQLTLALHQAFPECTVRILSPVCPVNCPESLWIVHHPGIECLAAADIVVGGGGYNTVYECASVGVPLVALALPRLYDRQHKRVSKGYWVQNIAEALATVRILLDQRDTKNQSFVRTYTNGAIQAVHHIINYEL